MGLANMMGQGYGAGYPDGYADGQNGGGSPKSSPIRMVVGHHHTGDYIHGGGCYTASGGQCGARINWTNGGVESAWENTYHYWATGTCANGHSVRADKYSPTGVDPGEIRYQPCRTAVYALPSGHPSEGSFVRNVDVFPGQTPSDVLNLTVNEMVTAVKKYS